MNAIKITFNDDGTIRRVVGDVGQTRMSRAAYALNKGKIEPSFGYKLRRCCKRAYWTACAAFDNAAAIALGTDVPASDVPVIGMLEEHV